MSEQPLTRELLPVHLNRSRQALRPAPALRGALDEPDENRFHLQPGQHNATCGSPRSAIIFAVEREIL
jgi:hypothetical protein